MIMPTELNMEKKVESNAGDARSIAGREEQWQGLRRVPDKLPKIALLILAVEVRIQCFRVFEVWRVELRRSVAW